MENINDSFEYFKAKKAITILSYILLLAYLGLIAIGIVIVVLPEIEFKYEAIGFLATWGYGIYGLYKVYRMLSLKVGLSEDKIMVYSKTVDWKDITSAEYKIASNLDPVIILKLKDERAVNIPASISELDYIKSKIEKKVDNIIRNNE